MSVEGAVKQSAAVWRRLVGCRGAAGSGRAFAATTSTARQQRRARRLPATCVSSSHSTTAKLKTSLAVVARWPAITSGASQRGFMAVAELSCDSPSSTNLLRQGEGQGGGGPFSKTKEKKKKREVPGAERSGRTRWGSL